MKTAQDFKNEAKNARQRAYDSFESCDTDGFLTQWAAGKTADLAETKAKILEDGGAEFTGLYEGDRRVKAKLLNGQYGYYWLLHEDEEALIAKRGKPFLPAGRNSRVHKGLGVAERVEVAPAWCKLDGHGTGLSGTCFVAVFRTGDAWGQDAKVKA